MKRTLQLLLIFAIFGFAIFSLDNTFSSTKAQTTTDELSIIPLPVPTNVIGTFVRSVSTDGKRIAFESINDYFPNNTINNKDSNTEIWVYDVDSRSVIQITDTKNITDPNDSTKVLTEINNVTPVFSGDGTKLVFASNAALGGTNNDDGNYEIYLADLPRGATQATFTRLTDTGTNSNDEFIKAIATNYQPTINDDGSVISFVSTRRVFNQLPNGTPAFMASNDDGNGDIFVYNLAQKQYSQVTISKDEDITIPFGITGFNSNPILSGNGQTLAFLANFNYPGANANKNSDFNAEIYLYKVGDASNSFTQVTDTTGLALVPFLNITTGQYGISTNSPVNLLAATTRPLNRDGTLLVIESAGNFDGSNADRTREIWLYNVSTKAFTKLTNQTVSTVPTQDELKRLDYSFFPSINSAGTFISLGATLNLVPTSPSDVKTDNADGSREVFRYDIAANKFRQLSFTPASSAVLDQHNITFPAYLDATGNLATFSTLASSVGPNAPNLFDLFQSRILPVTGTNAQAPALANAASFDGTQIARGSIAAAFGDSLANTAQPAPGANLPFELNGVTVNVAGVAARIYYVSAGQVNFALPQYIANGDSVAFTINNNGLLATGKVKVVDAAPGVFMIGPQQPAAQCGRTSPNGMGFDLTSPPCSVGNESNADVLVIFGTGWRNSASVQVKIGDQTLTPSFAGAQPDYPGFDQINVNLTKDLAEKTDLDLSVTISGSTTIESNKSKISFLPFQNALTMANAASFEGGNAAPSSSAIAYGQGLSTDTVSGAAFQLAGVTTTVAGVPALMTYVSPGQVNFIVPQEVKPASLVEVLINNNGTISRGRVNVLQASPGLFTTTGDGNGRVLAQCGVVNTDGTVTFTGPPPCSVGTDANPNVLRVFGTGWRNAEKIVLKVGDQSLTPTFFGAQDTLGVDVIDVKLVTALAGKADVDVIVTTTVASTDKSSKAGIKISFNSN